MKRLSAALFIAGASMAIAFGGNGDGVAFQKYRWENVEIVGGGFVSGILYHPKQENLIYARTDIGGAYRWDPKTKRWVQLLDWIQRPDWNLYGVESIGLDPTDPKRLYLALGTYTNSWAGNGAILRSTDQGRTFQRTDLPFKLGGILLASGLPSIQTRPASSTLVLAATVCGKAVTLEQLGASKRSFLSIQPLTESASASKYLIRLLVVKDNRHR